MSLMEPSFSNINYTCDCSLWNLLEGTIDTKALFKVDEQEPRPEIQDKALIIPLTAFPVSRMSRFLFLSRTLRCVKRTLCEGLKAK